MCALRSNPQKTKQQLFLGCILMSGFWQKKKIGLANPRLLGLDTPQYRTNFLAVIFFKAIKLLP